MTKPNLDESQRSTIEAEWRKHIEPMLGIAGHIGEFVTDPDDAQLRQEFYRSLFSTMAMGYIGNCFSDARYPDFWPYFTSAFNWLGPNPDNDYYVTYLDDKGTYKICGFRGTVFKVDFQMGNGAFVPNAVIDDKYLGHTLANYNPDTLPPDENGYFEVLLSAERPEDYVGYWWPLPESTTYMLTRQVSCDWLGEQDGRFSIERLDVPVSKPRPDAIQIESQLSQIANWTETLLRASFGFTDTVRQQAGHNELIYKDLSDAGGIISQRYVYGVFKLEADEALLIEVDVSEQYKYWALHLADDQFFTLDWVHRQTSLNSFTGVIDSDGKLRVVLSASDPGTANWLDTMGYQSGVIQGRWEECNRYPDHKAAVVKLAELGKHLPEDHVRVDASARNESISKRRRGAQMRKRW